ncbi:hypothetical protein FNL56_16315 [Tardiphaga sp. vice304]|uniref:hypothetical protein n=1 Tax=Tardiphaga sp. vice304 TaxID=2592817 RepID=UPI0011642F5E|nr:hypothetical protein [Tardiphaga sp. vice304]QDM27510.1 hypothetical protein FNL56_16315 [Tardiphaga sp. vice304]
MSRRDKISALLESSTFPGEREAARRALQRQHDTADVSVFPQFCPQPVGGPEWQHEIQKWTAMLQFCTSHLGTPGLSNAEIVLIRNWTKSRGDPWQAGARDLMKVYEKLKKQVVQ